MLYDQDPEWHTEPLLFVKLTDVLAAVVRARSTTHAKATVALDEAHQLFDGALHAIGGWSKPWQADRNDALVEQSIDLTDARRLTMTAVVVVRGFEAPLRLVDFRLAAFDMDSTLITIECVDEIAAVAGRGAEVAAITEAAMRGEIADYKESLRRRVALLAGVPAEALQRVYDERLRLSPGAETLVDACRSAGLKTLLVSGGFTFFTDRVRDRLGIDFTRSNVLEIVAGALTGRMVDQPWGDICDGAEKRKMLLETCASLGIDPTRSIAVGDGANDLPMMAAAGLSVAYHAKPKVREAAMVAINSGGLDRLLEVVRPPA